MTTTLPAAPEGGWGLDDFLDTIAAELPQLGILVEAPDRRTIRYYATVGVLDRPTLAGREARYADRHLAQVLALKRLQGEGVRLAAITQRLAGLSTADLVAIATGPFETPAARTPQGSGNAARQTQGSGNAARQPQDRESTEPMVRTQSCLTLAPGVRLILDDVSVSPTEALALTQAAAGLLARITALGLDKD